MERQAFVYYELSDNAETSKVGAVPQLEAPVLSRYEPGAANNFHNLNPRAFIDDPNVNVFKLRKRAKRTNILTSQLMPAIGMFVDAKTKSLLEQFHVMNGRFYPADIYSADEKEIIKNYFFFHLIVCDKSLIDYDHSLFVDIRNSAKPVEDKSNLTMWDIPKEIFLTRNDLDMFRIPFSIYPMLSERLRDALINEKISGISLQAGTNIRLFTGR